MTYTDPTAIELLAPARNLECGIAAIDHGADAVYIGAQRFGARAAAGNSLDDIVALCSYARQFGVRVYVTVNTILYDDELQETHRLVWELYRAGVDALIVQDLALLEMDLPPIALHASTQMDNRSAEKVSWLLSLGFRQAVLARELTLHEIEDIHRAVPQMPLEVFCHGALCVSYSGQCYASQYCFHRSANRGECAQFCRLPFSLVDGEGNTLVRNRHLLSLKDMNRSLWLEQMMDAGVSSFKIEGRMKDVAYVKNVTAYYRQQLDAILRRRTEYVRSSFGRETFTFCPDPDRSFSRGFTDYFINGRQADMSSPMTPKSRGQYVGTLKELGRDHIVVSGTASFHNGDGLCYLDAQGSLQGFRVNRAEGNRLYLNVQESLSIAPGTKLYRSFDQEWNRLMAGHTADRRMVVNWTLQETPAGFCLTAVREDGLRRSADFDMAHEPARSDQTEQIRDVLSKTGNTSFMTVAVSVVFSQPWFIPRSQLAEWRRTLLNLLMVEPVHPVKYMDGFSEKHGSLQADEVSPVFNLPSTYLANVSNRLSHRFYVAHGVTQVASAVEVEPESLHRGGGVLMHCRFCLRYEKGWCPRLKPSGPMPPEPYWLQLSDGRRFRLRFDCRRCEMYVLAE